MIESATIKLGGSTYLAGSRSGLLGRNDLRSFLVSTAWGRDAARELRSYILAAAGNADPRIGSVADLSRATGIKQSVFSKWFSGAEQPSVRSLQRIAPIIKAPLRDLLILACRVSEEDLGLVEAPEVPDVIGHPLARELDRMLGDESPLDEAQQRLLSAMVDASLDRYRSRRRSV